MHKIKKYEVLLFSVFRIFVGLLFMQHGAQKLFGWFGGNSVGLFSLMGAAGVIEFFGGLLLVVGLFTRPVALIAALEMLVAYFKAHFPSGFIPLMNKGELALLFFACFLVLLVYGANKFSLDALWFKKE